MPQGPHRDFRPRRRRVIARMPESELTTAANASGGIVIRTDGTILLRAPSGHYGGYVRTLPQGRRDPRESAEAAALREVCEETGFPARITGTKPEKFSC